MKINSNAVKHALVALGIGIASAMALIPPTGEIHYRAAALAGIQATLTALGVGVYAAKK